MTELDLRETLEQHLGAVDVPPAPLGPVVVRGRRQRRRRRLVAASVTVAVAALAASGIALVGSHAGGRGTDDSAYASLGALDFSHGARAYADPGRELHLAGRTFPYGDLDYLDTSAVATAYGMVFFDRGRPMLLGPDGQVVALVDGPLDEPDDFHPTAKTDAIKPYVAFATVHDGVTTLTVHNLETGLDRASTEVDCDGPCTDLVIEAIDSGIVYVGTDAGTRTWDYSNNVWADFAGPKTQIADVRTNVVLFDGANFDPYGSAYRGPRIWTLVKGPTDASLTFDGKYVLDWSSRLHSTDGGPDLVLDRGATKQGALGFWAIDSDGSVLVADPGRYPEYTVYDCEVATGACEELGPLETRSGDPEFIGTDG